MDVKSRVKQHATHACEASPALAFVACSKAPSRASSAKSSTEHEAACASPTVKSSGRHEARYGTNNGNKQVVMRCNAGIDEACDGEIQLLSMFQVQTAVLWRRRRMRCHRARSVYICKRASERASDAVDQPQRL